MAEVNLLGFGYAAVEEVAAASKTLDLGDCGVVQNVTVDSTVTLPATSAKNHFVLRVGADNVTLNISPNAADKIWGAGVNGGTDNKDVIFTDQPIGSFIELRGDGTDGYVVVRSHGTFTFEA